MITKHEALDTLDRLEFFQGQRAGRELWFEKSSQLQDIDIACFVRDLSNLREYIQAADIASRAEWISVEERLPDNCRAVLVALEGLTIGGAPAMVIGSYSGGFWMIADADGTHYLTKYMRYVVTHWMPLPEPPKTD